MKALKMSVIHVVAFIVSWTPYTVMGTWLVQHHHSKHDSLSLFQSSSSMFLHLHSFLWVGGVNPCEKKYVADLDMISHIDPVRKNP